MLKDILVIENDWETKEGFRVYLRTLEELDGDDKAIQKKFTHSTTYVCESLIRHFKPWNKIVLFLALFSNQPTASIIAILLNDQNTT